MMHTLLLILAIVLNSAGYAQAAASWPAPAAVVAPVPAPSLPSYYDTFNPPTSTAAPVSGAPSFAEWIRQAAPGDSILFTGDQLAAFTFYGQTGAQGSLQASTPVFQDTLESQVALPMCLPPNSAYLAWSTNGSGASAPAIINGTELWWGNDMALPGDTAAVFGRNFYYGGLTPTVYVQAPGQAGAVAQLAAYNNYRIDYVMPAGVAAQGATVQVWVHNGHAGAYGWSGPVSVALNPTVNDDAYWSGAAFNVKSYGAVGDGATDDGPAITAALNAAAASAQSTGRPATVYLPGSGAGTVYLSNRGFNNLARVRWMGDGKAQTILRLGPGFAAGDGSGDNSALFYEASGMSGHGDHVEIRDMTLDINNNLQGANAAANGYHLLLETSVNDFKLSNLAVQSGEPLSGAQSDSLIFKGSQPGSHAWVQGCDFYGGGLGFGAQSQVFVDGCTFHGQYDAPFFVDSMGGIGFSLTRCTAQDYNNGGDANANPNPNYYDGRLYAGSGANGNRCTYIAENTTIACAPRVGGGHSGNAGEQVLWESGSGPHLSVTPVSAGPATLQLPGGASAYGPDASGRAYAYAVVVAGKGLGQARLITADNGSGLLGVSPNWNVIPDGSSTVQIQPANEKTVVYANHLQGKPGYQTSGTSSAGVDPYLDCFGFVVDHNSISQTVHGLFMWSSIDSNGLHPGYFGLFTDNTVSDSLTGASANSTNWVGTSIPGVALLGTDFRRNNLNNSGLGTMQTGFSESLSDANPYSPRIASTLVDQNLGTYLALASAAPVPTDPRIYHTLYNADNFCATGSCAPIVLNPCVTLAPGSPTPSRTATATATRTPNPTATATRTPSPTATATCTPSPTATATRTPSPTATATQSASPRPTSTFSATATASATVVPSATRTATNVSTTQVNASATPTSTSSPSATATPGDGVSVANLGKTPAPTPWPYSIIKLDQAYAVPNPNPSCMMVHLEGAVDDVQVRIYDKAMVFLWQSNSGPRAEGWAQIPLDTGALTAAGNGLFYVMLTPTGHGSTGKRVVTRLMILR